MPEAFSLLQPRQRNPYDAFDEPAAVNPYDQFDTDDEKREREDRAKWGAQNVGGMFARGALDQGVGSAVEGAVRGADAVSRGAQSRAALGEEYQRLGGSLGELERAEMQSPHPSRQIQIAAIKQRMTEMETAAAPRVKEIAASPGLKPAAAKVGEFRQAVRDVYPVDEDVQRSIPGQVTSGVGQVLGSIPAYLTGLGVPAAASQMFEQGYTDAVKNGADEETALQSGIANLPAALLEQLGNKLQLGGLVKALRGGGQGSKEIIRQGVKALAGEAGTEALQQLHQNTVAKVLYDEGREVTEGVGTAALVGGLTGATVATGTTALGQGLGKLDTRKNVPEANATLSAQQEQLVAGLRPAQMFPVDEAGEVRNELKLPKGMERVETDRGIFHFNPELISAAQIVEASRAGRENDVLALGDYSKADVEKTGEPPLAITERTRDGTEVKTAVSTKSLAADTAAALERTKTPGNVVATESLGQTLADRGADKSFVDDLMAADAKRVLEADQARKREAAERAKRQVELAAKRKLFDDRVRVARETFAKQDATFSEVNGALESVRHYAEDNSLGLSLEQKQIAAKAQQALEQRVQILRPIEEAKRAAESAKLTAQAEAQRAAAEAARSAGKQEFKQEVAAGRSADGGLNYDSLKDDKLAELAQDGDRRAERVLMTRNATEGDTRPKLLDVLAQVKLPATDAALGGELKTLLFENMNTAQRKRYMSPRGSNLDTVAEVLRADHGFSGIKTPADVIDVVQRALRGEDIRADRTGEGQFEFAAPRGWSSIEGDGAPAPIERSDGEVDSEIAALRREFPALTRDVDLKSGLVEGELRKAGYKGRVPTSVQAAIYQLRAEKRLLVIATHAAKQGKASGLLLHELAHPFYDALPEETKSVLRELHAREMKERSGPLFDKDGNQKTDIAVAASEFSKERLAADSDLPVKEWFAERVRALNEGWLRGRIPKEHTLIRTLWQRLLSTVRSIFAQVRGLDPAGDLFTDNFRRWLDTGAKADVGDAALAYAARSKAGDVNFAAEKPDPDDVMANAAKVPALPKVDRKAALRAELQRGREMRDEADRTGNNAAMAEGTRLVRLATERLDEEFPGWDQAPAPESAVDDTPSENPVADPADQEPSAFNPAEDETMPVRQGKFDEVYGQGGYHPSAIATSWAKVRDIFTGIRGSIPELPTFPQAAWNRGDSFIRQHGGAFYNRLKEGFRSLRSGTDYVQRTAEEQVARVIRPLIEAGGKFDANDYAKLRNRQEQVRRLRAEKRPVSKGIEAEISALNSKLESSPYVLFNRLVLALDLNWRQQNLKDSEGNPIKLPANVNAAEVSAELKRLAQKIAASPHSEKIQTALRQHMELVKQAAEDLKDRELLAAEHLDNPYYFPHLTLEVNKGNEVEQRELKPSRVKPGTEADFRGYLLEPVGSSKAIETDYLRAMYYHLVQLGAHNFKADVVRDFFRPYDIKAEVEAAAKKLSRERGVPVSWEQAWHEVYEPQGYVLYGTDSRDAFPSITINRDALARRLGVMLTSEDLHAQLKRLGLQGVKLLPEDLQETLDQGKKETWIVPARVAEALRGIADRENPQTSAIDTAAKYALGAWKAWKLFMPWNHVRYEYGNVIADLEKLLSADPRTFKFMAQSAKEVREFWRGGNPSDDLRAALKEGVVNAITAQEMGQLQRQHAFDAFQTTAEKAWNQFKRRSSSAVYQPVSNLFGMGDFSSVEMSAFREAVFRYAKFKADLEAIRNGARPHYAGAYWKDIEAMEDSAKGANDAAVRKAAAISKATFGNYGDLSVLGTALRDKLIPFYSWMEVNFKYHANLLRNLRDMVRAGEMSQAEAMKKGGRSAAVFAAGFTARTAGGIALRLALPYMAVAIWNATGGRDELEELLSDEDRRRFHIILGEAKGGNSTLRDGRKIEVVYGNTAFMDVLKWFGGPALMQQTAAWLNGKTDFKTAFSNWRDRLVPDVINNTLGSAGPFLKIPYTLASKKNPFPDVLDQRTVPAFDMRRVILGQITDEFTADAIERVANKDYYASKDFGTWARQLILQVRQRDPQAWAFYEIKDKAATFLEQQTGQKRETSYDAPDQQALRNFRRAIYRGDVESATRFYVRLLEYGYTAERFAASIRAQDPLSALPKENGLRRQFVESLTPFDRAQLDRAYEFYQRMNSNRGRESVLFPRQRSGERGVENFRASPRTEQLETMMEAAGSSDEDTLQQRAQQDLRRSLRRGP